MMGKKKKKGNGDPGGAATSPATSTRGGTRGDTLGGELFGSVLVRPSGAERRISAGPLELRVREADPDADQAARIEGYAALFNKPSSDLGGFIELIEPGTFAGTIAEDDVRALHNHNRDQVLGRNTAGTLELAEDETGLRVSIVPPGATWAEDLLVSMRRGDVDQMSFGFDVIRDEWKTIGGQLYRYLFEARLIDVSVVTFPAYQETIAEVRAIAEGWQDPEGGRGAHSDPGEPGEESRGRLSLARARVALLQARAHIKSRGGTT